MSGNSKDNILLFGATGYIGEYILKRLLQEKAKFGRIAIFTSANTASRKGWRNVIEQQIKWIEIAEKSSSVKRFFPSEFGTDIEYGPSSAQEIPHQLKLKVRGALKETSRLEFTYIVTGPYADAVEPAFFGPCAAFPELGSFNVKNKSAVLVRDGTGKISFTSPQDVGKLVVKALFHPLEAKNKALKVNSFRTTPNEILAEFEKQCGEGKWAVKYTSNDELRKLEKDAWSNKHPMAPIFTLRRVWGEGGTLYEKRDNGLIDAEDMQTLSEAVSAAIATQLSGDIDSQKDRKFM
ncbi:putative isoflavone reductase like protein [Mollisia scopiformis]|uniref:Putative isoflavone reductase like protein n=1 Tax=Mollisia scopiformis TaxID=149040 RepID=A0A194XC92_MOLSC|nr:putative isoflavone reductase like protein [Mollisia scopiformis]KUJ17785.1 putative isoflavone reductase like protein [Mollisia scopiformis]